MGSGGTRSWAPAEIEHYDDDEGGDRQPEPLDGVTAMFFRRQRVGQQLEVALVADRQRRIEAGDYGVCTKCGAEIGAARLDLLPFTPFCKDCA